MFQHLVGSGAGSRPDGVRMASGWRPDGVRMESGWRRDGVRMASGWWDGVQMRQDRPDCISQRPYCGLDAVQVVRKAFGRYPDASGRIRTSFGRHRVLIARGAREENLQTTFQQMFQQLEG